MFEKEIKFIGDFCFNQVRSLGNSFTLEKIIGTGIHPAIVQYISAELEYMIYSDRQKLLQQSYFDYTGKEISDHFQKISGEIKKHKKISIDDAKKLIFQAVSFNINYLVRPRWSLTKLIFNEQPVISAEEMKMMFNYLYYYEYFRKVLTGYISKRNLMQISSTEFEIILDKIDGELINSNQQQVVSNSFTSIGDFFNIGGVDKNLLPLTAVEIFCKEKNLLDLLVKLRKVVPNDVKRRFDKVEIERIIFASDVMLKVDKSEILESEIKTDEMIEKLDSDEPKSGIEEENEKISDQMQKTNTESFLSPEEEEALLSLYSEESKETAEPIEIEVTDTVEVGNAANSTELLNDVEDLELFEEEKTESNITETEPEHSETKIQEETNTETESSPDEKSFGSFIDSDKELDEIVDAITEDLSMTDQVMENNILDEIENLTDTEIENQSGTEETDTLETGVEKEIVQEMIRDFYGDTESETSQEVGNEEMDLTKQQEETILENPEDKIESLENELLNIFEDLDKFDLHLPQKGRAFEQTAENEVKVNIENLDNGTNSNSIKKDSLDDYHKNIDELISSENQIPDIDVSDRAEIQEEIVQQEEDVEVPEQSVLPKEKIEKPSTKVRNIRPKDLFSYLRRKEIKKIVSFIFANDEEDFTNTVERVMDCHSYKEASEILKAVFTSYKISPYSKEAITFTNAVSNYFRQA
jgi:hypothetical protein